MDATVEKGIIILNIKYDAIWNAGQSYYF